MVFEEGEVEKVVHLAYEERTPSRECMRFLWILCETLSLGVRVLFANALHELS